MKQSAFASVIYSCVTGVNSKVFEDNITLLRCLIQRKISTFILFKINISSMGFNANLRRGRLETPLPQSLTEVVCNVLSVFLVFIFQFFCHFSNFQKYVFKNNII